MALRHALVRVGLLPIRRGPDHRAERVTDAALGTPLRYRHGQSGPTDEWWKVRLEDGYEGYARSLGLEPCSPTRASLFRRARRLVDLFAEARSSARGPILALLPAGSRVLVAARGPASGWRRIELPDGRVGVMRGTLDSVPARFAVGEVVRQALRFQGVPYVWGGRTSWGLDCSGLVQLAVELAGGRIARDARDQWLAGRPVGRRTAETLAPGDLLFFGPKPSEITHVAIHLGAGRYVHAYGCVQVHSLRPSDPEYLPAVARLFRGARRLR